MQFLLIARDGRDALKRRLALREEHLAVASVLKASGNLLYGVAMLDDAGQPNGSMEVVQFDSRADLDRWLAREPFVTGEVWAEVNVTPCRVGPMFGTR
jgi:hypothetical protein